MGLYIPSGAICSWLFGPYSISLMVLRETAILCLAGVICALPLTFAADRLIRSSLYGVQAGDSVILGSAVLLLLLVAKIAGRRSGPLRRES